MGIKNIVIIAIAIVGKKGVLRKMQNQMNLTIILSSINEINFQILIIKR